LKKIQTKEIDSNLFEAAEKEVSHFLRYGVFIEWIQKDGRSKPSISTESERQSYREKDRSMSVDTNVHIDTELKIVSEMPE